jgi:hypothetical protein
MELNGIPVDLSGGHIGVASIEDDGTITIQSESPLAVGVQIKDLFETGTYVALMISPRTQMPPELPPQPSPTPPNPNDPNAQP